MTGTAIISDLDQTLIFSAAALRLAGPDHLAPRLVCVEVHEGRPLSFVTDVAARHLTDLAESRMFVPATTRTIEQYRRIRLPGPTPPFALCANGGRLLRDGVEDLDFTASVTERLASSGAPLGEVYEELQRIGAPGDRTPFVHRVREAQGLFCYAVVERDALPDGWVDELTQFAAERSWGVSVQGRKVYCVPASLTKAVSAREVVEMLGATRWVSAGDSLLDAELIDAADAAIRPRHGELAEVGWAPEHVQVTDGVGVLAGEEIATWLAASR